VVSAWLWPVVLACSRCAAVTGFARPLPGSYGMNVPAMLLEQHESGIHVVWPGARGAGV